MNKKIYILGMVALVMLLASCKKNKETESVKFFATIENDGSKTELYDASKVKWLANDAIKVYNGEGTYEFNCGQNSGASVTFTKTGTSTMIETNEYMCFYPTNKATNMTEKTCTFTMGETQSYKAGSFNDDLFPMVAYSTNPNLQFRHVFGLLKIPVKGNTTLNSIVLTSSSNDKLYGKFTVNYDDMNDASRNWGVSYVSDGGNSITLNTNVQLTAEEKYFYFVLPPGSLNGAFTCTFNYGNESKTVSYNGAGHSIVRKTINTTNTVNVEKVFAFTVNGDGKQVTFSPGNLYIEGTSAGNGNKNGYVFKFEAEQYDYRVYYSETHTGVFNWSNSNSASGNGQFGWPGLHWRYPSESPSAYDQGTVFYDWGEAYIMDSKGTVYPPKTWRTLSINEWDYVLNGRDGNYSKWVKVNGKNGIIILPDGSNIDLNSYSNINYSTWKNLEQQGAAFLVAADAGIELDGGWYTWHENNSCWYWTSTNTSIDQARHVDSDMPKIQASGNSGQGNKMNVRLVKDVQ